MSSIAHTQPRNGRRNFTLRAYLAGTAATAALIGAVVLAFASLGAYVAFNGLPIGGTDTPTEATSVAVGASAATETRATPRRAQDVAAASVTRDQGSGAAAQAGAGSTAAAGGEQATPAPAQTTAAPAETTAAPTGTTTGSSETTPASPPQNGPSDNPPAASEPIPQVTGPNAVGGTVGAVEQTLQDAGVDVPLTGSGSALDEVSGLLGD